MYKTLTAISPERHAGQLWQGFTSYAFAAGEAVLPLCAAEMPRAVAEMATGFMRQGEAVSLVALCALTPGQNLYVGPDGRWLGNYVPAVLRGYPFAVVQRPEGGEPVVCIDEASGLLSETEGEPLFDDTHKPAGKFAQVVDFLTHLERDRKITQLLCDLLDRHGLFADWPLKVDAGNGPQDVTGILRIDEAALNALSAEAFLELRQAGALPLVYAHLLSTLRLPVLSRLAQIQAQLTAQLAGQPQTRLEDVFELPGADDLEFNFD